jgi:hypothetical protein
MREIKEIEVWWQLQWDGRLQVHSEVEGKRGREGGRKSWVEVRGRRFVASTVYNGCNFKVAVNGDDTHDGLAIFFTCPVRHTARWPQVERSYGAF